MSDLKTFQQNYITRVEEFLTATIISERAEKKLTEAVLYSLQAGGKRIRPLLTFAVIDALGGDPLLGLETAAAIEMIHTYSLIHDDLPAMDNDDYRRGKLTNHKVYGEATAILAGDALLTYAFEIIAKGQLKAETKVLVIQLLTKSAGMSGMVGGQQADLNGENNELTLAELTSIHSRKTGALLQAAILSGSYIGKANPKQMKQLAIFAKHIGIAFQICDDILDVRGDASKMGKKTGTDEALKKSTYPSLLTLKGAEQALEEHYNEARQALLNADFPAEYLLAIATQIVNRDH